MKVVSKGLIATQTPFAVLKIKSKPAVMDDNLNKTKEYLQYIDPGEKRVNDLIPEEYQISNMPPMIITLPVNSVFSFIDIIDYRTPDLRFVPINTGKYFKSRRYPNINRWNEEMPKPRVVERKRAALEEHRPVKGLGIPIFTDRLPKRFRIALPGDQDEEEEYNKNNIEDDPIFASLADEPLAIDQSTALAIVTDQSWTRFLQILADDYVALYNNTAENVLVYVLSRLKNVTQRTVVETIRQENKHMNAETVKIGVTTALVKSMQTDQLNKLSKERCLELSEMISNKVDEYKSRAEESKRATVNGNDDNDDVPLININNNPFINNNNNPFTGRNNNNNPFIGRLVDI